MMKQIWLGLPRIINNPIVLRELVAQLRKSSSFVKLFLFLGALSLVMALIWYDMTEGDRYQNVEYGRSVFLVISALMGGMAAFLVPISSAVQINLERERDTWDLLTATPLSMQSILLGKFLSTILFVLLLFAAAIPVYGLSVTIGGVAPEEIAIVLAAVTESTAVIALIGILCSIRYKKPMTSVASTYVLSLVYFLLLPFVGVAKYNLYEYFGWEQSPFLFGLPFFISPLSFVMLYFNRNIPAPPEYVSPWCIAHPILAHGIAASIVLSLIVVWALWGLHRLRGKDERRLISILRRTVRRRERSRQSAKPFENVKLFSDRRNPVSEKDLRETCASNQYLFWWTTAILFIVGCLLLGLHVRNGSQQLYFAITWRDYMPYVVLWTFPFFLLPHAAGSIRTELDVGAWDVLRTTTLSAWKIVAGKVRACYTLFLWRMAAFYGLAFIIGVLTTGRVYFVPSGADYLRLSRSFEFIVGSLVVILAAAFLYTALGVYISSRTKTTSRAYLGVFFAVALFFSAFGFVAPLFGRLGITLWENYGIYISPLILCLNASSSPHDGAAIFRDLSWKHCIFVQAVWEIIFSIQLMRLSARRIEEMQE